jgi:hypothetical protein
MVVSKKAAGLSPDITKQISKIEHMTLDEIQTLLRNYYLRVPSDKLPTGLGALAKAANKRIRAIKREIHDDPSRARELLGH